MIASAVKDRFETQVRPRLARLRRRLRFYLLLDGLAILSLSLVAVVGVTLLVDWTFRLDTDMRLVQLVSLTAALAGIAWRFIADPLRIRITINQLATLIERRHVDLKSRLISAVEFASATEATPPRPRSSELTEAVVRQTTEAIEAISFEDVLAHRRARAKMAVTLGCALALTLAGLLATTTMSVWLRRNVLLQNLDWPQRNRLTIEGLRNGRMIVARGDDVSINASVDAGYEAPRQVFIEYQSDSGQTGRQQMPAVRSDGPAAAAASATRPSSRVRFTHTFERLAETMRCRVVGGDARTDWFTLETVDRPEVRDITLHVTPPAYTQTEPYDLRAGQTVAQALIGSRIGFHVRTNRSIADIRLIRQAAEKQEEIPSLTRIGDQEFAAEDLPPASSIYWFRMTDVLGLSNTSERSRPVQISVRLTADQPPSVKLRIRGAGDMIVPEAVLPVEIECTDTFGLASAALTARAQKEDALPTTQPVEGFEPGTKTFRRSLDWVPVQHGFHEGDRINLQAEAADLDDVSGPNIGRSQAIGLRLVSREELLADLQRREQEYRLDYERWVRRQEELYGELLSLVEAAGRLDDAERSRQLRQLARRQRDYAGRVGTTKTQFEQVLAELRVNQLSTPSVESRLGRGIVEPLDSLYRSQMPAAADLLDQTPPAMPPEAIGRARRSQAEVLAAMKAVLANMLKWEGFQEAVTLLRDIESMQRQISQEMEKRIIDEMIGSPPTTTRPEESRK